ncbi:MAG: redox-sensing transcriptional repressor Rex [Acidimicrobiales bacterium]
MSDRTPDPGRFPGRPPAPGRSGSVAGAVEPDGAWPAMGNGRGSTGPERPPNGQGPVVPAGSRAGRRIPEATVARLPVYLRALVELADSRTVTISSERLAEMGGVNAAKVRKDLSYLGSYGTRGVGYEVEYLLVQISRILGLTQDWPVVIVGIGNLGHALANYRGFAARGFRIAALVDADPTKVGELVGSLVVRSIDELPRIAVDEGVAIGIIATPAAVAQDVADRLVSAGVSSILNFAPAIVTVRRGVSVRKVDLSIELQILSFYQQRRAADLRAPDGDGMGLAVAGDASGVGIS